jgi:EmrB/QacA subfamily drug resistance transporter
MAEPLDKLNTQHAEQQPPEYSHKWTYFAVAAIAAFMGTLDSSIVNVALPTLAQRFHADIDVTAWVAQSYILTMTAFLLVAGKLLDIWGERKQFVIGFAIFTVGSALCAFSISIYMLIFSRVFQALGGAVLTSSNQGLIAKAFPPNQRGRTLGTIGTVVSVGLATGPVLGGFLIGHLGWRSIFFINLPIGAIAIIYALRNLASNPTATDGYKFDWLGSWLIIAGLGLLFTGMSLSSDMGWSDPMVSVSIGIAVVLMVIFVINEQKARNPIFHFSLLKSRYLTQSAICPFLAFVGLTANSILMPFYLQDVMGLTPQQLGLFMMTVPASMLIFAPLAGHVSDLVGTRIPATFGLGVLSAGLFMLSFLDKSATHFQIVWHLALVGFGMGIFSSPNSNAILSSVPRSNVGLVSGLTALMRTSGITFGIGLSVFFFTLFRSNAAASGITGHSSLFVAGLQPAFKVSALIVVIALVLSATRGSRPRVGN